MIFEMDKTYTFNSKSSTILNSEYKNMKVVSIMSYKQAIRFTGKAFNDVATIRKQLILELGSTLLEVTEVNYILFEDEYGNEVLLAYDWIIEDSITAVEALSWKINIPSITSSEMVTISNMIKALGYTNITYTVV